jgi:DNA polymerase-1
MKTSTRSRRAETDAVVDLATAPLPFLLHRADEFGTGFRLHGRAVGVIEPGLMSPDLSSALHARVGEIYEHLGGVAVDGPPCELLNSLGIELVIPQNLAEAEAALAQIEIDSDTYTPEEIRDRPGLVGFDIETAALPGEEERPAAKLRKDGYLYKTQPKFDSAAGLDPNRSRIRLVQLHGGGDRVVVLDTDLIALEALRPLLQRRTLVIHSADFELRHLTAAGFEVPHFECSLQAAGLLLGVYRRGLDDAVAEYFDTELPKGLQRSDWPAPYLSFGQYSYAALDAIFALRLWLKERAELLAKGRGGAYLLQRDVLPAVVRLTARGVLLDDDVHTQQNDTWKTERAAAIARFLTAETARRIEKGIVVPDNPQEMLPDAPNKVRAYLKDVLPPGQLAIWSRTPKGGQLSVRNADLRRVAHLEPIRALLAITALEKLIGGFGADLRDKISAKTGRLHPGYIVSGAKTARASSRNPNIQQMPGKRAPEFRRCLAAGPGMVFVVGDYATMELRAAAAISGDPVMNADFANGVDLHKQQAAAMLGIEYDAVDKDARDKAKAINFGIIYGSSAAGLAASAWNNFGIEITIEDAETARQTFLGRYSTYRRWMEMSHALATQNGVLPIGLLGRVIEASWEAKSTTNGASRWHPSSAEDAEDYDADDYWDDAEEGDGSGDFAADNSYGQFQEALRYTLCCNGPIQGSCADASMLALLKVDAALRAAGIEGGPVLWIHDEIVLEVRQEDAERARQILIDTMTAAFAETFPDAPLNGVVETGVGTNWANAKP